MANLYTDMELDDDSKLNAVQSYPGLADQKPQYPYGLRGCLCEQELDKLGLDAADFKVGELIHMHQLAKITSVHEDRVEFQTVELKVEDEDKEDEDFDDGER